ncbi:MAG: hypothetical protein HQK58_16805 [Deltaproteobacteria bacterium]|nr:hypothetical protein [Deltaproteobacteria bacterium]
MKTRRNIFLMIYLLSGVTLLLAGCGGSATSTPGTVGEWNPIITTAIGLSGTTQSDDVDCFPNAGGCPTGQHKISIRTDAVITITNADNEGSTTAGKATNVTISKYTIDYRRSETESQPAPVLSSRTIYQTFSLPPRVSTLFTVAMIDIATKKEFADQWLNTHAVPPDFPVRYTVIYTFYGNNDFGNVQCVVTIDVRLGNFGSINGTSTCVAN